MTCKLTLHLPIFVVFRRIISRTKPRPCFFGIRCEFPRLSMPISTLQESANNKAKTTQVQPLRLRRVPTSLSVRSINFPAVGRSFLNYGNGTDVLVFNSSLGLEFDRTAT